VKTWPVVLAALSLTACGARSSLYTPAPEPGKTPSYCQKTSDTSVYVVTDQSALLRFDAPSGAFDPIGTFACPVATPGAHPFSMAVDHDGKAYVIFDDGELFEVSTKSASCAATAFVAAQSALGAPFGCGFAADASGAAVETLFIASVGTPAKLGTLDTSTFAVETVGAFSTDIGAAELTGTGDGRLFAFGPVSGNGTAHFAEVDPTDATILLDTPVPTPSNPQSWAFAFWGGDFYFFTDGTVGRYHSADGSFDASYAELPGQFIVGAGVSTCAPQ
jgi:predicted small lipoprotein YifL